jgi:hypothetical protein
VAFKPLDSFALPCLDGQLSPTRNQVNLIKAHALTIVVTAPATIAWSMLIQE